MATKTTIRKADRKGKKLSAPKRTKMDLDRVLAKMVSLISRHNPSELSYSKIARLTGIPRSTLYYYFGNSPKVLIDEAVKYGMKTFVLLYGFDGTQKVTDWKEFQTKRLMEVVQLVKRYPWAPGLYFKYRNHPGDWGTMIREVENAYCLKLADTWKKLNGKAADHRAIRLAGYLKLGVLWGLAAEPDLWRLNENDQMLKSLAEQLTELITQVISKDFLDSKNEN